MSDTNTEAKKVSPLLAQLRAQRDSHEIEVQTELVKNEIAALPQNEFETAIVAMEDRLAAMLPATVDENEAVRIVHRTLELVRTTPGLAQCGNTIMGGVLTCAQLGLELGVNALGEAYLIPLKGKATLIIGYKGYRKLVWQSGMVKTMHREIVYTNDHFKRRYAPQRILEHEPAEGDRGGVRGYYAIVELMNGGVMWDYFTYDEAVAFRDAYAMAKNGGAWKSNFHEMALKTILKRVLLDCPMSIEDRLFQAAHLDGSVRYVHKEDREDPTKLNPGDLLNRAQLEEAFRHSPDTIDGEAVEDDGITDVEPEQLDDPAPVVDPETVHDIDDVNFILDWCKTNNEKPLEAISSATGVKKSTIHAYTRTEIKRAATALASVAGSPNPPTD